MKDFRLNNQSGRQETWEVDGYRWVAAEPRRNGFVLWGYQDDTAKVVHLGSSTYEGELEKMAENFLLGDPETTNPPFLRKEARVHSAGWCGIEPQRRRGRDLDERRARRPRIQFR